MDLITATKSNFRIFCQWVFPDLEIANHHEKIIEHLQEIYDGKNERLVINLPP